MADRKLVPLQPKLERHQDPFVVPVKTKVIAALQKEESRPLEDAFPAAGLDRGGLSARMELKSDSGSSSPETARTRTPPRGRTKPMRDPPRAQTGLVSPSESVSEHAPLKLKVPAVPSLPASASKKDPLDKRAPTNENGWRLE
jgi:hypothetical protein